MLKKIIIMLLIFLFMLVIFICGIVTRKLWDNAHDKKSEACIIAPLGVTEYQKPVVSNEVFLGLANALLIEAAVGTGIYAIWTQSIPAGIVSVGLGYATYRIIRKSL